MKFKANMKDVQEQGVIMTLPAGKYECMIAQVIDKETESGDPMVNIKLVVVAGEHQDNWLWDNIVIPQEHSRAWKILGRTKHFLHCIGEPYEGEIVEGNSENWLNKLVLIETDIEKANQYHKYDKPIVKRYILKETPGETLIDESNLDL